MRFQALLLFLDLQRQELQRTSRIGDVLARLRKVQLHSPNSFADAVQWSTNQWEKLCRRTVD